MDPGKKSRRLELCVLRWRLLLGSRIGRTRPGLRLPHGAAGSWTKALPLGSSTPGPREWLGGADRPAWVGLESKAVLGGFTPGLGWGQGKDGVPGRRFTQVTWSSELSEAGNGELQAPSARRLCTHMQVPHVQFTLIFSLPLTAPAFCQACELLKGRLS